MSEPTQQDKPTSVVEVVDHAAAAKQRAKDEERKVAAQRRAEHLAALETEKAYLTRTPNPNKSRLADVQDQIDEYSKEPKARTRETAQAPDAAAAEKAAADKAAADVAAAEKAAARAEARKAVAAKKAAAKKPGS